MRTYVTVSKKGKRRIVSEVKPGNHPDFGDVIWADWKEYSTGLWFVIQWKMFDDEFVQDQRGKHKERTVRSDRLPRLLVKHLLKGVSFAEVEHNEDGEVSDECLKEIMNVNPKILDALLEPVQALTEIGDDEEKQIQREGFIFFGPTAGGIEDPCYALHLYSVLSGFWSELGMSYFDLFRFPVEKGVRIRELMQVKAEASKIEKPPPPKPGQPRRPPKGA